MPITVGVVLSGCGFRDGAEIHEAVLTLLALDRMGAAPPPVVVLKTNCAPVVNEVLSTSPVEVIVVDDDVDIYSAEEIMWAMHTRLDAQSNMMVIPDPGTSGRANGPLQPVARIGLDLTAPKASQQHYWRGEYPQVDLRRWFSGDQIASAVAEQGEYARLLARRRV